MCNIIDILHEIAYSSLGISGMRIVHSDIHRRFYNGRIEHEYARNSYCDNKSENQYFRTYIFHNISI